MKCGQFVIGPAGSGKSTFCSTIVRHCEAIKRPVHVVNLDPAAEHFDYPVSVDIRDLISLEDVVDELKYGPNGALIYCMEYLIENIEWLQEQLGDFDEDYLLFDCPGQIELYTHFPLMRQLVDYITTWQYRLCAVYIMDSQFIDDLSKYFSGALSAMSSMIILELPHVNVLSKVDLLQRNKASIKTGSHKIFNRTFERFLEVDPTLMCDDVHQISSSKFSRLNNAIISLLEDYSMVSFVPLDVTDEDSVGYVLSIIDSSIQFGEDAEPKEPGSDLDEEKEFDLNQNAQ